MRTVNIWLENERIILMRRCSVGFRRNFRSFWVHIVVTPCWHSGQNIQDVFQNQKWYIFFFVLNFCDSFTRNFSRWGSQSRPKTVMSKLEDFFIDKFVFKKIINIFVAPKKWILIIWLWGLKKMLIFRKISGLN